MRIDELNPQHQMSLNMTKWKSVQQVQKFLKGKGFRRLGSGAYSEAWGKDSENTVVKISTEEDVCWLNYARWVQAQPANKHLPKIYSIKTYEVEYGTLFISRVEMLEEMDDYYEHIDQNIGKTPDPKKAGEMLWLSLLWWDDIDDLLDNAVAVKQMSRSVLLQRPEFKGLTGKQISHKLLQNFSKSKLAVLVNKIHSVMEKDKRCYRDLHQGNVMRRHDGTVVIMDPAAMKYTSDTWS